MYIVSRRRASLQLLLLNGFMIHLLLSGIEVNENEKIENVCELGLPNYRKKDTI